MSEELDDNSIKDDELLARFILNKRWIRRTDSTPRPDAFIPPSDLNLSVTRHKGLSEKDIWRLGKNIADTVAQKRVNVKLEGRADLQVNDVHNHTLNVEAHPLPENANHAHITGWPLDKPKQKSIAQELAAIAQYKPY
jgi:hypothetical protein